MNLKALLTATILATATLTSNAAVRPHSKTIVVESPENHPILAQGNPEAMYLHDTSDGRSLLYVEVENGGSLNTLDVTDPANIQSIARTTIAAKTAFDFVEPIGEQAVLIRYRDSSGVALLSFKHYKQPVLVADPTIDEDAVSEPLGQTGLLLASSQRAYLPVSQPLNAPRNYKVIDTENSMQPALLAMISDVQQRLTKSDTGTLFLLNRDGITVVRRLRVEQDHQVELDAQMGN
jgi:hypothetical protein